ncbi:MAG TPA: FAD-binding oxidoreductase [Ktedonobacterales bacterium]|nr:FAD-binding oxidoreductase [Ktedonobacterales bacterium]
MPNMDIDMAGAGERVTPPVAARIDLGAIHALEARLQGRLIRPGDADYDEARAVWNGMIDRYPALIARCASVDDVVAAVGFAREQGLLVAVRGGAHSVAGHAVCDGGLVIDLSRMARVEVDPEARVARAGGGATWGEVDAATQAYGLATPGGVFSRTGIAGLTLGGGFGWLRNTYGLSCDNLVAAEIVTADGRVLRASETENRELLWGLRGGGGNFGVVTRFEYRLHPVGPEVMFVFALHDGGGENMARAIRFYRDFCSGAPDEANTIAACGIVPPHPEMYPVELHGRPFVLLGGLYAGPPEDGKRALQPLRDFGAPLVDFSGVRPYVEAQQAFDADYPDGMRYYWKSLNLMRLDNAVIDRLVAHARQQPSPLSTTDLWSVGGAMKRGDAAQSAFHGRHAAFLLNPEANWEDPRDDEANIRWARKFIADMREFSDGGRYLNFAGFQEEGDEMMRGAFGPQYARLLALKRQYDPANLFRLNQNISPGADVVTVGS